MNHPLYQTEYAARAEERSLALTARQDKLRAALTANVPALEDLASEGIEWAQEVLEALSETAGIESPRLQRQRGRLGYRLVKIEPEGEV